MVRDVFLDGWVGSSMVNADWVGLGYIRNLSIIDPSIIPACASQESSTSSGVLQPIPLSIITAVSLGAIKY